jgi:hypothetical protein
MMIYHKIRYLAVTWPARIRRLFLHLLYPIFKNTRLTNRIRPIGFWGWILSFFFYVVDVLGLPELLEILFMIFLWRIRPMSDDEKCLCLPIFGNNIDLNVVTIDRDTRIGMEIADAYVTFNTINYQRELPAHIFIHEMVHIWQYQKFGSIYIPHALHAQKHGGYNYGGVLKLYKSMVAGRHLTTYNFEQQAEIIEHLFQLKELGLDDEQPIHAQTYAYYQSHLSDFG